MSDIRLRGMLVTGFGASIRRVHTAAVELFGEEGEGMVSALSQQMVNGTRSFAVFPTGALEGTEIARWGHATRDRFVKRLQREDVAGEVSWVEVSWGAGVPEVLGGGDWDRRSEGGGEPAPFQSGGGAPDWEEPYHERCQECDGRGLVAAVEPSSGTWANYPCKRCWGRGWVPKAVSQ